MKNKIKDYKDKEWNFLGIPFNEISFDETLDVIDNTINQNKQLIISTLNVNWIVTAQKDKEFKKAVIKSDINVIDGTPLLWLARLKGFKGKETIAGSSLIQYLHSKKNKKSYSVFWFGGKKNIAKKASEKTRNSNLKLAGYHNPGFCSVKKMSSKEIIDKINKANPDILLLALGAKKGVKWIDKNKNKLNANIISHVGATINFIAGDIKRAPKWIQKSGLEWLWRIKEEPRLWKRYLTDSIYLMKFLTRNKNISKNKNRTNDRNKRR